MELLIKKFISSFLLFLCPGKIEVKVKNVLNLAPRHENLWGNGGIAASFLTSTLDVLSAKRHAPVVLLPGPAQALHFVEEEARSTVLV